MIFEVSQDPWPVALLSTVLAAVGVFISTIGWKMVKAIQDNTEAVRGLTGNMGRLMEQHERDMQAQRLQMEANTKMVLDALKEGIRDVSQQLQEQGGNRPGRKQ